MHTADGYKVGPPRPDDLTRKVSWDMVRRSAKASAGERVLQVSTKCRSVEELLGRFAPFATEDSLTVPARPGILVGERLVMKVSLADHTEVFSARGEVLEVKDASQGATDSRPVARVRLLEMDEGSQALFLSLSSRAPVRKSPLVVLEDNERTVIPSGGETTDLDKAPTARGPRPSLPAPPPIPRRNAVTRRPLTPVPPLRSPPLPEPERAAGSLYKLPANPLADLNADAVLSFVDCNVYESTEEGPPREEVTRRAPNPLISAESGAEVDAGLEIVRASAVSQRGQETTPLPEFNAPWQRKLRSGWSIVQRLVGKLPPPLRRTLVQAVPFAFCTLLGWCVGFNMAGLEPRPKATVDETPRTFVRTHSLPSPSEPVPREALPAALPVAAPKVAPSDAPLPAPSPAITQLSGGCQARIQVRPSGVSVTWNGQALGVTPLPDTAVPCGLGRVVLERERWETVVRQVTVHEGPPVEVSVRMNRPVGQLLVTTTPPGANIEINGQVVGKTPRKISSRRFETIKIGLRLEGYRSWHSEVFLRAATEKLDIQLDPLPKAKPAAKTVK